MDIITLILIVMGLGIFEVIVSVDNAIVNADVLYTMSGWARRWFLVWGFLFAVLVVRGIVPWLIVWTSNPALGAWGALTASFSSDARIIESINQSAPVLLMAGATFLILLFLHWLFAEPKNFDNVLEKYIQKKSLFYIFALIAVALLFAFGHRKNPSLAYSSLIGASVFFITDIFKERAEAKKNQLVGKGSRASNWSKIFYLEVLDATFSVDSVLGAFAFTLSVPLILIGNGLGVFIVRRLTVSNISKIEKYVFLKNGAMYSIFILSIIMVLDSFGRNIPDWVSPVITFTVVGWFFYRSREKLKEMSFKTKSL